MVTVKPHKNFEGVFWVDKKLATKNLVPGEQVYGERLIKTKQGEFREWDARRSKPSAAIYKGLHHFPLKKGMRVLYLGLASSTTASHFSDIIGKEGIIYGIDVAERVLRESIHVAESRENILPLLFDARKPEDYPWIEEVDVIYQDVAVKEQSDILIRNAKMFLKPNGFAMIAIKSRSIDVTQKPKVVYKNQRKILEKFFSVTDFVTLQPYQVDHCMFMLRSRS